MSTTPTDTTTTDAKADVERSLDELTEEGSAPFAAADAGDEVAAKRATRKRGAKASPKPGTARAGAGDRVTFKDAAEQVLRKADGPLKVKAIAEAAIPLVRPKSTGKTPAATLSAHLVVDANKGGRFVKTAPGTFDVRELNPRGAAKRPRKRAAK